MEFGLKKDDVECGKFILKAKQIWSVKLLMKIDGMANIKT